MKKNAISFSVREMQISAMRHHQTDKAGTKCHLTQCWQRYVEMVIFIYREGKCPFLKVFKKTSEHISKFKCTFFIQQFYF